MDELIGLIILDVVSNNFPIGGYDLIEKVCLVYQDEYGSITLHGKDSFAEKVAMITEDLVNRNKLLTISYSYKSTFRILIFPVNTQIFYREDRVV